MINEQELKQRVRSVLFNNMIEEDFPEKGLHYCYTMPSPESYPFQYFWDTCFHIIMLTTIGEYKHAKMHLSTLFSAQRSDGFIGNIVYWKKDFPARFTDFFQMKFTEIIKFSSPHMSNILQPPLVAQALLRIYEETGDIEYVKKMLPKLKSYYKWLANNRDFDGDSLISIITNFESGMDWKPTFDPVVNFKRQKANSQLFRKVVWIDFKNFINNYNLKKIAKENYFRVKDAGFNSIYAKNLQEMAELCRIVEDKDETYFKKLADKVMARMIEILYDEKDAAFYDTYGPDNKKIKILTPTAFYPVIVNHISKQIDKKVMDKHFFESKEFKTDYPIPSVAKNDPSFNPESSLFIWRGPTWIVNNWLMHKYMTQKGYHENAQMLFKSVLKLVEQSGFREYYNPFTGEGYGAKDFTWGGLILDMINTKKRYQEK